jgi:hypothetical protein
MKYTPIRWVRTRVMGGYDSTREGLNGGFEGFHMP